MEVAHFTLLVILAGLGVNIALNILYARDYGRRLQKGRPLA